MRIGKRLFRNLDLQSSSLRPDVVGITPVQIASLPVVEVLRCPERVLAGVELSAVDVELVREDQVHRPTVVTDLAVRRLWRVGVDECSIGDGRGVADDDSVAVLGEGGRILLLERARFPERDDGEDWDEKNGQRCSTTETSSFDDLAAGFVLGAKFGDELQPSMRLERASLTSDLPMKRTTRAPPTVTRAPTLRKRPPDQLLPRKPGVSTIMRARPSRGSLLPGLCSSSSSSTANRPPPGAPCLEYTPTSWESAYLLSAPVREGEEPAAAKGRCELDEAAS